MTKGLNYEMLPNHMVLGVKGYIEDGTPPGDFLTAVICNDLTEAFARADETNIARMFDIVSFFYSEAPLACWKTKEKMDFWIKAHREAKERQGKQKRGKNMAKDRIRNLLILVGICLVVLLFVFWTVNAA